MRKPFARPIASWRGSTIPMSTRATRRRKSASKILTKPTKCFLILQKRKKYDEMRRYHQQYGRWPGEGRPAAGAAAGGGSFQRWETISIAPSTKKTWKTSSAASRPSLVSLKPTSIRASAPGGQRRSRGGPSAARERPATRGEDTEAEIEVTLAEAYQGAKRTIELTEPDGTSRRLEITIPAGVDEGARIRLAGQGRAGRAGRGDLYVRVRLLPDPRFTREGAPCVPSVEVPLAVAMLGGEAHVPTPDGRRLLLRIPSPTQNGRTFRLRGQGMPTRIGRTEQRGDLIAEVKVALPTQLNDEQRRLFEAFARSIGYTGSTTPPELEAAMSEPQNPSRSSERRADRLL